jgi:hypothetical protein
MNNIYWLLGYPDETELEQADEKQKHLKHIMCRQIEKSNKITLNNIKEDTDGFKLIKRKRKKKKKK